MTLYVDENAVAAADFRTQTGHYALAGEGLAVGRDTRRSGDAAYGAGFAFKNGRIVRVVYDVAEDVYLDLERKLAAVMARD